jgi:hypothetical protein
VHAAQLAQNQGFRNALADRIAEGLPVWAECGGLAYLSRAIIDDETAHPMVGALPFDVELASRPRGHGYVRARVDRANPFFEVGTELRGHEFHYTQIAVDGTDVATVLNLERGTGVGHGRDGVLVGNVIATYTHLHALGTPSWADRFVRAAGDGTLSRGRRQTSERHRLPVVSDRSRLGRAEAGRTDRHPSARLGLRQRAELRAAERDEIAHELGHGARRQRRGLGARIRAAATAERIDELDQLIARDAGSVRHLVALSYQPDATLRRVAGRGLGVAGRYHPRLVQNVIRRLVWAMNDESGTNAVTAPEVLRAIAEQEPELLLPMVPDLVRLSADPGLQEGLAATLKTVASRCPGKVGHSLEKSLSQRFEDGGSCGIERSR